METTGNSSSVGNTKGVRCLPLFGALTLAVLTSSAQEQPSEDSATNLPAADATRDATVTPRGRTFDDFKLITERNIFDPNRRARSRTPEPERPPEPKVDIVALTGTLSYSQGTFAFFDSNSSEFRKTAKVGDEVAGYVLKEIDQSHVALERESKQLELKVGEQLRRQDEGPWEVTFGQRLSGGGSSSSGSSRRSSYSSRSSSRSDSGNYGRPSEPDGDGQAESTEGDNKEDNASASEDSGEGPSDVLKRLLEQRRKEQEQ